MWRIVASRLCASGQTTRIEYIGGCKALPSGDRLRGAGGGAFSVASETSDVDESSEVSLASLFSGSASSIGSFLAKLLASCMKDDADDLSERKLDLPVSEVPVRDGSELPDDKAGDSRERSEVRLGAGDLTESL